MKINRRNFIQTVGTAAAVTVSGGGLMSAIGQTADDGATLSLRNGRALFSMDATQVNGWVGQSFVAISPEGERMELVLAEVNRMWRDENAGRGYSGECFSAIFKNERTEDLAQGVYEMRGAGFDQFAALLVPTGRRRSELEMVVNRLKG